MNFEIIEHILALSHKDLGVLFKPVQTRVLKKYLSGKHLTENEKRYLRGNLRRKIEVIEKIIAEDQQRRNKELSNFLKNLGEYYITGFAALKHNGYGWYYDSKYIEVINTKLEGTIKVYGKRIVLKRVKSLGINNWRTDPKTGLRYATNERILHDARRSKQTELVRIWISLFNRYEKMFVKNPNRYSQFQRILPDE